MGQVYTQLREVDRYLVSQMLSKGYRKSKIAQILNVHRSTVYREVKRNSSLYPMMESAVYSGYMAHKNALERRKRHCKLLKDRALRHYVHEKLSQGWSPWQIEGRLKLENEGRGVISHESIYRYIYEHHAIRNRFYKKLRRKHFWRRKHNSRRSRIPHSLLIQNREESINSRIEYGHWECDLMIFKRGIRSNLITLRERKSRYLIAIKNLNKTAKSTALAIISTLKSIKGSVSSITFDQGSEFRKYSWIKDCLEAKIYFYHPASPEEKGAVENINGVIRSEMPRAYNLDAVTQKEVIKVVNEINNRPLKCLNYHTPAEVFNVWLNKAS